jgi:hypothetical protein
VYGTDQALREAAYIAASSLICLGFLSYVFIPRLFIKSVGMLRSSSAVKVSLAAVADIILVSKHCDVITQLMFRN